MAVHLFLLLLFIIICPSFSHWSGLTFSCLDKTCPLYIFTNLFHNFSEYVYFCSFFHKDLALFSKTSPCPVPLGEEAETNPLKCKYKSIYEHQLKFWTLISLQLSPNRLISWRLTYISCPEYFYNEPLNNWNLGIIPANSPPTINGMAEEGSIGSFSTNNVMPVTRGGHRGIRASINLKWEQKDCVRLPQARAHLFLPETWAPQTQSTKRR